MSEFTTNRTIGDKDRAIVFRSVGTEIQCKAVLPVGLQAKSLRRVDMVVIGLLARLENLKFCEDLEGAAEQRLTQLAEHLAESLGDGNGRAS